MQHGQDGFCFGFTQLPINVNNSGMFVPDLAETLRNSLNPSSLLAFSRASKVTPPSLLSSRSHLFMRSSLGLCFGTSLSHTDLTLSSVSVLSAVHRMIKRSAPW